LEFAQTLSQKKDTVLTNVILVTGASSGIGKATAEQLAQRGYRVFGTSRKPAARVKGVTMVALDVTDSASIRRCIDQVVAAAGRLDVLVNNAGIVGPVAASEETSTQQWRDVFNTNVFGVVEVTNAALAVMRPQGSGRIINVSSMAGYMAAPPYFGVYVASKHALEGYTEALRYEVAPFGIYVSLVELGYVLTNIGQTVFPPDHPIPDYVTLRQRVHEADMYSLKQGNSPAFVARQIIHIVEASAPALRYQVSSEAQTMALLKRLLPFMVVERFMNWLYMEGDWDTERPGVRRLFLDARLIRRIQYGYALTGTAIWFLWAWRRWRKGG
jgi:NAD(P)-dependent dehydrogenase (short-subunit alcohol dehydrogenase family)